jgi:hypothetical protein
VSIAPQKYLDRPLKDIPLCSKRLQRAEAWLYTKLDAVGLESMRPKLYWSTEWFTPDGSCTIALPYYLSTRSLCSYVKSLGGFVEGNTKTSFQKILLHEAGHCFEHIQGLRHCSRFTGLFGDWTERVKPHPTQDPQQRLEYVSVVGQAYGSKHPLEDFAETFAYAVLQGIRTVQPGTGLATRDQKIRYVYQKILLASKKPNNAKTEHFDGHSSRVRKTLRALMRKC